MSEVMDPHVLQPGAHADAAPGLLQVGVVGAGQIMTVVRNAGYAAPTSCRTSGRSQIGQCSTAAATPNATAAIHTAS